MKGYVQEVETVVPVDRFMVHAGSMDRYHGQVKLAQE
jgi:hypothetical protein